MSVYKIRIDTANLVEAPPYLRPVDNRPLFLGPGTKATVQITLYGNQGVSQPITVSGATGKVLYGALDIGTLPLVNEWLYRPRTILRRQKRDHCPETGAAAGCG